MHKSIVLDNQKIKTKTSDILGVGGEATVLKVGNVAVKIWKKPSSNRVEKLEDLLKLGTLPNTVCGPIKPVYDSTGKVIGFAMQPLSPQYEVMQMLASKKHRRQHPSLTSAAVTDILLSGYDTIAQLHPMGIIIGDNNDLNALYWKTRMVYIDVDSFQFGVHPCMVGTENFLPPALYDIPLATKPLFKPLHDWYGWFVMFVRSVLMVHPFGGVHRDLKTVPQRATAGVTFLDSTVKYPKAGLHPDLLNSDLKALFDRMFVKGELLKPDREIFVEYRNSLQKCASCNTMYPSENSACPQCSKINVQQIQRQVKVVKKPGKRTVNSEILISTTGQIIWQHLHGRNIYVIANEAGQLMLYKNSPNSRTASMPLMPFDGSPKFEFFDGKYLAYNDGMSDQLRIFEISGSKPIDTKHRPFVGSYQGDRVFAGSSDRLMRVHQGYLFATRYDHRLGTFIDANIDAVSENQTWISASSHSSLTFSCQRLFETLKYSNFRFDPTRIWSSPIADLEPGESIIDTSTFFTGSAILFLIKTEIKGKTYTHVYVLYEDKIKSHARLEAVSSDIYRNIHGKTFAMSPKGAIVLHPTDDGIVQELITASGQSKAGLMSETEQFVSESDSLYQYGSGILVTGDQSANYLTIG